MVFMVAAFAAADFLLVQAGRLISTSVEAELRASFGDVLEFESVEAGLSGPVSLIEIALRASPGGEPVVRARRAIVEVEDALPTEIALYDAELWLTAEARRQWAERAPTMPRGPRPAIRIPSARAHVETDSGTHDLEIIDASMLPDGRGGYAVRAAVCGGDFGSGIVSGFIRADGSVSLQIAPSEIELGAARQLFPEFPDSLWERLQPQGFASLSVDVDAGPGGEPRMRWSAALRDVYISHLGLRLGPLVGAVECDRSMTGWLESPPGVAASAAGGRLTAHYRADAMRAGAEWELRFALEKFPLEAVPAVLPEGVLETWNGFSPRGSADFSGVARGRLGGEGQRVRVDVRFDNAAFTVPVFGELTGLEGVADYDGDVLEIWRMTGGPDSPQRVSISARIDGLEAGTPRVRAEFTCEDLPLDRFMQIAAARFPVGDHLEPLEDAGTVTVSWSTDGGAERLRARFNGNRARARAFPLPLCNIRGEVLMEGGRVVFEGIEAAPDGVATPEGTSPIIRLHGYVDPASPGMTSEFWIEARDLPVTDSLRACLPVAVRSMTEFAALEGRAQVSATVATRAAGTSFVVELGLSEASLDPGVQVRDVAGSVFVDGVTSGGRTHLTGHVRFPRATVHGHPIRDLTADFTLGEAAATFHHIRADLYGGALQGDARVSLEDRSFESGFQVHALRLDEWAAARQRYSERGLSGHVNVWLDDLHGTLDDPATFAGAGRVEIADGFIWGIPVFVRLLDLDVSRMLATGPREMRGDILFTVAESAVRITRMTLSDETLTVFGRGRVGFDGQMRMLLKTFPNYGFSLPGIDLLKYVFNELRGEVYAWEATGPFDNPELSWQLFPSLSGEE